MKRLTITPKGDLRSSKKGELVLYEEANDVYNKIQENHIKEINSLVLSIEEVLDEFPLSMQKKLVEVQNLLNLCQRKSYMKKLEQPVQNLKDSSDSVSLRNVTVEEKKL